MKQKAAIARVRSCIAAIKPGAELDSVRDDTPLLESRVIKSFDVLELILHLEQASGRSIRRTQLVPGSFRDIATIARVFLSEDDSE